MFDTAIAQLRFAASLVFGWPFGLGSLEHLVDALRGRVQQFLLCGTIWVYGHNATVPATEDQPLQQAWWEDQKERPPLLIFDPGHSSAPKDTKVEDLWAVSAAANPWMGGEAREIEAL